MENVEKKWSELAWQLEGPVDRMPQLYSVLTGEGLDVARACQRYWQPGKNPNGEVIYPGLVSAVGANFPASAPEDLVELVKELTDAQTEYRLLVGRSGAAPTDRAQFVLSEIRATLTWVFDDGARSDQDQQLVALAEAHDAAHSQDDVAAALFEYAEMADRNRGAIAGVGGFDVGLIEEARALGQALREASAGPAEAQKPETRVALELRNRLGILLYERMQTARAAFRFVFRHHPDIARKASSTYERRVRTERRKRMQEQVETAVGAVESTGGA